MAMGRQLGNRTTEKTLERASYEALPQTRMVCPDEQYMDKVVR